MSDQVIRYDSKEQYIEHKNHLRSLATGELVDFPNWGEDPDAYWEVWHKRMKENPEQMFEMWTLLVDETINDDGSLDRQEVAYETMRYKDQSECLASRHAVTIGALPDPGVPCSAEFGSRRLAERMRSLLMKGEPGYYYDILHRTECEVVETGAKAP